jgi:hypothetical protein
LRDFPGYESLALSGDSGLAAAWKRMSQDLAIVEVATGSVISILAGDSRQEFEKAAFSPDGRYVATGHHQGLVKLWDVRSGLPVRALGDLFHQRVSAIAFSADGRRVAAASNTVGRDLPLVHTWDADTGYTNMNLVAVGRTSPVHSIAFSSDSKWIATGHYQGEVLIWDPFEANVACALRDFGVSNVGPITHVGFSADGTHAFARRSDGLAKVWRVTNCLAGYRHRMTISTELRTSALFQPKGEFETSEQYAARTTRAREFEDAVLERFGSKHVEEERAKAAAVRQKMRASSKPTVLKIDAVGMYNADRQVFPVTIGGITEIVRVPAGEAKQFKDTLASAKVTGTTRLQNDLQRHELVDVVITNPKTGTAYAFGRQEAATWVPRWYSPPSPAEPKEVTSPRSTTTE